MKTINGPKDCMDFHNIESYASKKGVAIEYGKGDHAKLVYKNSMMVYPRRTMGFGLACKVFKWLMQMGLLCLVIVVILVYLRLNGYTFFA